MEKVKLDESTRRRLSESRDHIEVTDDDGKTIGHIVPEEEYRRLLWAWATSEEVTREELAAARQEYRQHGGMTTAEAIAYIRRYAGETPA